MKEKKTPTVAAAVRLCRLLNCLVLSSTAAVQQAVSFAAAAAACQRMQIWVWSNTHCVTVCACVCVKERGGIAQSHCGCELHTLAALFEIKRQEMKNKQKKYSKLHFLFSVFLVPPAEWLP